MKEANATRLSTAEARNGQEDRLRIAIMTTPRSGNTWLRHLLGSVYDIPTTAVNTPDEIAWHDLPERCVIAVHCHPEPDFLRLLADHDFRPVTMARHPLDVLISILHFASAGDNAEVYTARWLSSERGNESGIVNKLPTSSQFLDYSVSPRAEALMSVSREWSAVPDCLTVCYEDLVTNSVAELAGITNQLESAPDPAVVAAVEANTLEKLRRSAQNEHHWMGSPGLWRVLLPSKPAKRIAAAHVASFDLFQYECDTDDDLTPLEARLRWFQLELDAVKKEIRRLRLL